MALTVNKGTLQYEDTDGLTTTVIWQNGVQSESISSLYNTRVLKDGGTIEATQCLENTLISLGIETEREYCGFGDSPLTIKWAGDRYSNTAPSSASIQLLIKDLNDRAFLEDIFNGGYTVTVYKEYPPESLSIYDEYVFWKGQITPDLGIAEYKQYPYNLILNANDGLKTAESKQFLMIDFPEPSPDFYPDKISMLDVIIKLINKQLYPRNSFTLYIANRLYYEATYYALEQIFLDPRVFMEIDDDFYISHEDVLNSLLGPFHLQLVQWKGDWWLLALDAQWDAGTITYTQYDVIGSEFTRSAEQTMNLGILDLYYEPRTPVDVDREINANANISFLPPWQTVNIEQEFQKNTCILPAFANRGGNFYRGSVDENGDFVELEFEQFSTIPPQSGYLRHWDDYGLIVTQYPNRDNAGYAALDLKGRYAPDELYNSISVDTTDIVASNGVQGFKLSFNTSTIINAWINELEGIDYPGYQDWAQFEIEIKYNYDGTDFWYWNNDGEFDGFSDSFHLYVLDNEPWNFDIVFPKSGVNVIEPGGTLTISMYRPRSPMNYCEGYFLINNFQLSTYNADWESIDYKDPLKVDINPDGTVVRNYNYIWGLMALGLESDQQIHLSSPYDNTDAVIEQFKKRGEEVDELEPYTNPLLEWKSRSFINENTEYTASLSGEYKSDLISPLQLINDYEGRVYKFTKGTWDDKRGYWKTDFTEAKFVKNLPTGSISYEKGDFNPVEYSDDFFKTV